MIAPIALFVFKRPDLMKRTLDALVMNSLAAQSPLFIFSDGPRSPDDVEIIENLRAMAGEVKGFASVTVLAAEKNQGLSKSIIAGVTMLTERFGRCIVLEDDIVTSPYFLTFMNAALDKYANDHRVAAISGYTPNLNTPLPDTFFQLDAECWGWATWARAWGRFNPDGRALMSQLRQRGLLSFFDHYGTSDYVEMLHQQITGRNDSWAVRWRASVILAGMLSLYSGRSLTRNIGFNNSGEHSQSQQAHIWDVELLEVPVTLGDIAVVHSEAGFQAFKRFHFHHKPSGWVGFKRHIRRLLRACVVGLYF